MAWKHVNIAATISQNVMQSLTDFAVDGIVTIASACLTLVNAFVLICQQCHLIFHCPNPNPTSISMAASNATTKTALSGIAEQAKHAPCSSPTSCDDINPCLDYQICVGLSRNEVASHIIVSKITAALSILGSS